ncbi:unnamed protein product [Urochloa humidicola]
MYDDELPMSQYRSPAPPRSHMENLDLNCNADSFADLLQAGGGLGRSVRPAFLPPRQNLFGAGGSGAGRGRRSPGTFGVPSGFPIVGGGTSEGEGVPFGFGTQIGGTSAVPPGSASQGTGGSGAGRGGRRTGARGRGRGSSSLNVGPAARTRRPRAASTRSTVSDQQKEAEDDDNFDKPCWTHEKNSHLFCDLALEQIRLGNCPSLQFKWGAVETIQQKFYEQTGLWLKPRAFTNRFTQCKAMYNWLKEHMSSTGGGINVHGGLGGHSEQWWIDNCKGNLLECKKFKWGIPDYVNPWHEMFDNTSVDGSSASVPGDGAWGPQQGAQDAGKDDAQEAGQEDDTFRSPVSSGGKKRPGSTTDTATSPEGKKSKSPMLKCFNNFISTMHADNSKEKEVAMAIEIQEHIVQIKSQQKLLEEQKRIEDIDKVHAACEGSRSYR